MKMYSNFIKQVKSSFNNYLKQLRIDLFEYESSELMVGDRTRRYMCDTKTRDTIFLISCPASMNATDYTPTRFKCAINVVIEYMRLRAELCSNDRIALVCFNNETRQIIHLTDIRYDWTFSLEGREFEPRGTVHMGKGFGGVKRILRRQKQPATETYVILITDSPINGGIRFIDRLKKDHDIKIEVAAMGTHSASAEIHASFIQFGVHSQRDLITYITLLAERKV